MTIKQIALGACLLISGTALTQDKTYTVRQGDTLSEIASKFGVSTHSILAANNLHSADRLKLGQPLRIPPQAASKPSSNSVNDSSGYSVRAGDNDESIAKRLHVTPKQLRLANLGVKWTSLQIGQKLNVPGSKNWFAELSSRTQATPVVSAESNVKTAPVKLVAHSKVKPRTHVVRNGENDWIIAKHAGIKPSDLRQLNPNVDWTKLQIGTVLRIPGTVSDKPSAAPVLASKVDREPNLPRLRSRYAVIVGDNVTLRRGPSTRFENLTSVDKGTRILVLDREGAWYKARFPKGTEAWVRGDFLAPTKAPQLLAVNKPARPSKNSSKPSKRTTVVASRPSRSSRLSRNSGSVATRRPSYKGSPLVTATGAGENLIDKAQSFLGVRYRYGASSRSATDCSGFTTQVYRSMGVRLPRTAREQSGKGMKVGKGQLQPGDLVFFNTRGSRVSHVGIYKGNGQFIHASSGRGKVMVSSLNEGYYQRRFAGARRVIASKPKHKVVAKTEAPKSTPVEPASEPVEPKTSNPDQGGN